MAAYVIAVVEVHDAAGYEEYRSQTMATLLVYEGRFVVRGGAVEVIEGDWSPKRLIVVEFPTSDRARAWLDSPEYDAIKGIRHRTAHTNMIIVEGA